MYNPLYSASLTAASQQICLQASATRSQDEQYFSNQQALLQQQLADLRLKADKLRAEGREAADGLRKKRLKLQQDLEVHTCASCSSAGGKIVLLFGHL